MGKRKEEALDCLGAVIYYPSVFLVPGVLTGSTMAMWGKNEMATTLVLCGITAVTKFLTYGILERIGYSYGITEAAATVYGILAIADTIGSIAVTAADIFGEKEEK